MTGAICLQILAMGALGCLARLTRLSFPFAELYDCCKAAWRDIVGPASWKATEEYLNQRGTKIRVF